MSWSVSYRGPSNPGLENVNIHLPPKSMGKHPYTNTSYASYGPYERLKTENVMAAQTSTVDTSECKNHLEQMYAQNIKTKWYDENQNLHIWEYDAAGANESGADQLMKQLSQK